MDKEELKEWFRKISLRIIKMVDSMQNTIAGNAIAKQVIRSGTSPAANNRAAYIAKSSKDFLNKLKMVEEEVDETSHWHSIVMDAEMLARDRVYSPSTKKASNCKKSSSNLRYL